MKKSMPDLIISIILLAFLATLGLQLPEIPEVSRTYPLILLVIAAIMTVFMLVSRVVRLNKEDRIETNIKYQTGVILPYCLMIAFYLFIMDKVGYIIATALFMLTSLFYLKLKNRLLAFIITIVITAVLYFVFTNFLAVILPRGEWINISF